MRARVTQMDEDGNVVWREGRLLRFCEVLADAVDRGGVGEAEAGVIRLWIPDGTQGRLEELRESDDDDGVRAAAILESELLW